MSKAPDQTDDFSKTVLAAFTKRAKAIKRSGATIEIVTVKEIFDGRESDAGRTDVSIAYRVQAARTKLRIIAWGDRWVWIDARQSSKTGWVWQCTMDGRSMPVHDAREFVALAEKTITATYLPTEAVSQTIRELWQKYLAKGPREI